MSKSTRFWDRIARRYAAKPVADEASYQHKLALTRDTLGPEMRLFEYGCGTGSTAIVHAPSVREVLAIDFSAEMIAIARDKARAAGISNIRFEQADISEVSLANNSQDRILAMSVLHLLEDRAGALRKTWRLLKPGGLFISSTACLGDHMKFMRWIAPVGRWLRLMPMLKVFTVEELLADLRHAGFEIDSQWQPGRNKSVFIIARKPA